VSRALEHHRRALYLSENAGLSNIIGARALSSISNIMMNTGNPLGAEKNARKAQEYFVTLGDVYGQARALWVQARCQAILASYQHSQLLLQHAADLLSSFGLECSTFQMLIRNSQAEIHLLKTEYSEALQLLDASTTQRPTTYEELLANMKIASIYTATGVDSQAIHQKLDICQHGNKSLRGYNHTEIALFMEVVSTDLSLRDGNHTNANENFAGCLKSSQDNDRTELTLLCLERLADLSTGMNNVQTTFRWTAVFLGLSLKTKEKLATTKALNCLGQIFVARGDDETARSLFTVALGEFTSMGVHQWRANCMVQNANIWERNGDLLKSVQLLKAAKPLFQKSSQAKDIDRIDMKVSAIQRRG
jgi:hypothetical protein